MKLSTFQLAIIGLKSLSTKVFGQKQIDEAVKDMQEQQNIIITRQIEYGDVKK